MSATGNETEPSVLLDVVLQTQRRGRAGSRIRSLLLRRSSQSSQSPQVPVYTPLSTDSRKADDMDSQKAIIGDVAKMLESGQTAMSALSEGERTAAGGATAGVEMPGFKVVVQQGEAEYAVSPSEPVVETRTALPETEPSELLDAELQMQPPKRQRAGSVPHMHTILRRSTQPQVPVIYTPMQ
jgi:hypothetical protein